MSRNTYVAIIVIVLIIVIGALYFYWSGNQSQSNPYPAGSTTQVPTPQVEMQTSTPVTGSTPPSEGIVVAYTDSGFSPKTLTIKKGDTVTFKNNASDDVRVASNPHPVHNGYPTKGGCVGSTFDSCSNIPPGSSWSFTFGFVGSWGYHNHLNPSEGGTIVVQ